jgi:hypothetical protein
MKHDVGRIFGFVQAPVLRFLDLLENRAISVGELIQSAMQARRIPTISHCCAARQSSIAVKALSSSRWPIFCSNSRASQLYPLQEHCNRKGHEVGTRT